MRATTLLHHLPRPADGGEKPRRTIRRKRARGSSDGKPRLAGARGPASAPFAAASPAVQDAAVARVRSAGGPIDNASYTCACGYVFAASVSTTVACPHCGAHQAW